MSKPIRVMHVMGHMAGGGVESTVMNYYRHIDRNRIQFDFMVDSDSTVVPRKEIEGLGGRVFIVPPYKELPQYLRACETLFHEQNPDIVHSNINALSVFPLWAAKRADIPIRIAHSHSTANPKKYKKTVVKNVLKHFSEINPTHLAACSIHAAKWLFGDNAVNENRVHLIKNAINVNDFNFNPLIRSRKRRELGIGDEQFVVAQVGRICAQKNQMFTLSIFAELLKRRPNSLFVCVGSGELIRAAQYEVQELGLGEAVKFLGVRDDVAELYQAFYVLMFPSLYEGFGMAAVEAQATGLPVIASDYVPYEARIVPELMHVLPLKEHECWVKLLERINISQNRESGIGEIISAGYRIEDAAEMLCDWYGGLLEDTKEDN